MITSNPARVVPTPKKSLGGLGSQIKAPAAPDVAKGFKKALLKLK